MRIYLIIHLFLFFFFYTHEAVAENNVLLVGSDWCPYICTQTDNPQILAEKPGYLVDIIQYALQEKIISYESPSWKRAIMETRAGTYDAIVGIYTSVAPDFIYPQEEMGISKMCFYVKKENPWKYRGIESLDDIVLGIIDGYFYDEGEVDSYIKDNLDDKSKIESIPGKRGLIQNIEKMLLGRVTAIIDDYLVVESTLHKYKLSNNFKLAGCLEGLDVQVGFSPARSTSTLFAEKISTAIVELRKTGQLTTILNQYGIQDWKQF